MKYGLKDNDLHKIKTVLGQFPAIENAILYGSRAKGNYKNNSDIDLMLNGNGLDLVQLTTVMTMLDDLLLPYQFDVAIFHQVDNKELLEHIARVGVIIYTNNNSIAIA